MVIVVIIPMVIVVIIPMVIVVIIHLRERKRVRDVFYMNFRCIIFIHCEGCGFIGSYCKQFT